MSQAPDVQIIGVFDDRDQLDAAIEMLQSRGLERSQLSVLGTGDAQRGKLGMEVSAPSDPAGQVEAPIDASEKQNVTPLVAGIPAYAGAALAAGLTVATGGAAALVVAAAVAGGAGAGALGVAAAGAMRGGVDDSYAEQLAKGGIVLLIHPRSGEDVARAKEVLAQRAKRTVEMAPDRAMT